MNQLWYRDGRCRETVSEGQVRQAGPQMLESRFPVLAKRMLALMQRLVYVNTNNIPDGTWYDLFRFQPLVILTEIQTEDTGRWEEEFRQALQKGSVAMVRVAVRLEEKLADWRRRLAGAGKLRLTEDLYQEKTENPEGKEAVKERLFALLAVLRKLQHNYGIYLEEIEQSGRNDPAMGILVVFLHHYAEIAACFNAAWQNFPQVYFEELLNVRPRPAVPDRTWLALQKNPGVGDIPLKPGTAFTAGRQEDGSPFCYRTLEEIVVSDLWPVELCACLLEKDACHFPAARLGYVTAVLKNRRVLSEDTSAWEIFRGAECVAEPIGMLIESPMLLLREGMRKVDLQFGLLPESIMLLDRLIGRLGETGDFTEAEVRYKMLSDAFTLVLSTAEGWTEVSRYRAEYEDGKLQLTFYLYDLFPATVACQQEIHGQETVWPVLKIGLNRNAWLFAYSWARQLRFDRLSLKVEVKGTGQLKLYNVTGEQDVSAPVYLFGVQPERGAWMAFGSYEAAIKPLTSVGLCWNWQQLPDMPDGLAGYYRAYGDGMGNTAFRIRTGFRVGKKWREPEPAVCCLFTPEEGTLTDVGPLPAAARISIHIPEKIPAGKEVGEEEYAYNQPGGVFFRFVLDAPEMGFGHAAYRQLFAETMIHNSRSRHPRPVPNPPLAPLAEGFTLDYTAEEHLCFGAGQQWEKTRIYHSLSSVTGEVALADAGQPVAWVEGPATESILWFAFKKATGKQRIRFYVVMAALEQEVDERDGGEEMQEVQWWMYDRGKRIQLGAEALVLDTTKSLLNSGLIEIHLPGPVLPEQLDGEGRFWLGLVFPSAAVLRPPIRGVYTNVTEVVSEIPSADPDFDWTRGVPPGTITGAADDLPGIGAIRQIVAGTGGRKAGDRSEICRRMPERIAHRGRAVLPADYEQLVLEHFPRVGKVKCLPGLDSKGRGRRGIVTLVVIPDGTGALRPLATHQLLLDIEAELEKLCGKFVIIDAINPVYEEMILRCRLTLEPGTVSGEVLSRLACKAGEVIAPWEKAGKLPVFGHAFSLKSLGNVLQEDPGTAVLQELSLLHLTSAGERLYRLNEYRGEEERELRASIPWGILVPAARHLTETGTGKSPDPHTGIGRLEIGHTWVIG